MKTGKRILSVLLAVLMLAATLTVAFAAGDVKEPLVVTYLLPYTETWNKGSIRFAYQDSVYENNGEYYVSESTPAGIGVDYLRAVYETPEPGKELPSYLYFNADYNRPVYIIASDYGSDHVHLFEIRGFENASCTAETKGSYNCKRCAQSFTVTFPAEHIFGVEHQRKNRTCTEEGVYSRYCARCSDVQTRTEKPLNHCYLDGKSAYKKQRTVAPTCFTEGYDEEVCQFCGKIRMTNIKPANPKEHKDNNKDNHCDVCGTIINKPKETETSEEKAPKKNFFQRIIDWFRDLFKKLFK